MDLELLAIAALLGFMALLGVLAIIVISLDGVVRPVEPDDPTTIHMKPVPDQHGKQGRH